VAIVPAVANLRDILVRHRADCRYASPGYRNSKRLPARLIFGCGCPIYARLLIRHPDPNVAQFVAVLLADLDWLLGSSGAHE